MTRQNPPSAARIEAALSTIDPVFRDSPLYELRDEELDLIVKDETVNPIRSFKGRGTSFFIAAQPAGDAPLVTASAGNFGQGLAYNAARQGRPLYVFSSVNANPLKIEAMRGFGAEVIQAGDDFDAAKDAARAFADERGLQFVEDGASAEIAEGAGTIAAEMTGQTGPIDRIFVPLGNGALAAGIGCWFKARSPQTRIIAVAASAAPCMALSWKEGRPVSTPDARTIADGIAIRIPVPIAVDWLADTIDDVVLVEDAQILQAMQYAFDRWNRIVEPAGAAGLAAILAHRNDLRGLRVATILCGGNLTEAQIAEWLPAAQTERKVS